MKARILQATPGSAGYDSAIEDAAALLKAGNIVAFPTETVYGLGANALNEAAVARIFEAKGRPSTNPLIVHVSGIEQARTLTAEWTPEAETLAQALWPGPLTLVLKKARAIPDIVTAGGDTVALRCPNHPVALALLSACGFPLAAPSANRSNYISPTTADHVIRSLDGRIPLILDGGPCAAGIESTVLNLVNNQATILRPGPISAADIETCGIKINKVDDLYQDELNHILTSPGQMLIHYAPETPLILAPKDEIMDIVARQCAMGKRVALMRITQSIQNNFFPEAVMCTHPAGLGIFLLAAMSNNPAEYARSLYATLHLLDTKSLDLIFSELPPGNLAWAGITDRLTRASTRHNGHQEI